MITEEQVREIAERWRRQQEHLAGTEVELTRWRGYWWATFPIPGDTQRRFGASVLLIDPEDGRIQPGSSSIPPSTMIAKLEGSSRDTTAER